MLYVQIILNEKEHIVDGGAFLPYLQSLNVSQIQEINVISRGSLLSSQPQATLPEGGTIAALGPMAELTAILQKLQTVDGECERFQAQYNALLQDATALLTRLLHAYQHLSDQDASPDVLFDCLCGALESVSNIVSINLDPITSFKPVSTAVEQLYRSCTKTWATAFNELMQAPALQAGVTALAPHRVQLKTDERRGILSQMQRRIRQAGGYLSSTQQEKFQQLSAEIKTLQSTLYTLEDNLSQRVLYTVQAGDDQYFELTCLAGLIKTHEHNETRARYIAFDRTAYRMIMTYCPERSIRRTVYETWHDSFATHKSNQAVQSLLLQLAKLRQERAELLGYRDYATQAAENSVLGNVDNIMDFLARARPHFTTRRAIELREISDASTRYITDESSTLASWDILYVSNQVLQKHSQDGMPEASLPDAAQTDQRTYDQFFQDMLQKIARNLYHCELRDVTHEFPQFNEKMTCFAVYQENGRELLGHFFFDPYTRTGKSGVASVCPLRKRCYLEAGKTQLPILIFNAALSYDPNQPYINDFATQKSAQQLYSSVKTLTHEFGHLMHGLLSKVDYVNNAYSKLSRSIVEIPSTLMEALVTVPAFWECLLETSALPATLQGMLTFDLSYKPSIENPTPSSQWDHTLLEPLFDLLLYSQLFWSSQPTTPVDMGLLWEAIQEGCCQHADDTAYCLLLKDAKYHGAIPDFRLFFFADAGYSANFYGYFVAECYAAFLANLIIDSSPSGQMGFNTARFSAFCDTVLARGAGGTKPFAELFSDFLTRIQITGGIDLAATVNLLLGQAGTQSQDEKHLSASSVTLIEEIGRIYSRKQRYSQYMKDGMTVLELKNSVKTYRLYDHSLIEKQTFFSKVRDLTPTDPYHAMAIVPYEDQRQQKL